MLGCLCTTTAFGQYPGAYGSLAPSAFPVQYQQPPMSPQAFPQAGALGQMAPMQMVPNVGMQPGWYGQPNPTFQLVGAQEGGHSAPQFVAPQNPIPQNIVPAPLPMPGNGQSILEGGEPMPRSMHGPVQNQGQTQPYQSAPNSTMINPVYGQSIAPGCTSCGSAPLTESYAYPTNGPQYGTQYGAQPCQQSYSSQFGSRIANSARGSFFTGMPAGAKPYFGGGGVLLFHRVDDTNVNLTYDPANDPSGNVLGTRDARSGLMPGFEVFLGRYFNCGRNAAMISYWGLFPADQMATVTTNGGVDLRSRYHFTDVSMPAVGAYPQDSVYNWYDDARAHRIDRSSSYNNVEGNLLGFMTGGAARSFYLPTSGAVFSGVRGAQGGFGGGIGGGCGYCGGSGCGVCGGGQSNCGTGNCAQGNCGSCNACAPTRYATGPCCLTPGCGSRLNMTWLAGVRYFRFTDNLAYAASRADTTFGNGNDDIYYSSRVVNDLVGGQIGGIMNFCAGKRASLYALTKMGVYGNHARFNSDLGTRNDSAYVSSGPFTGDNYMISSSKTDVAFIGELGTGVNYRLTPKWSGIVGYRAIAASGVATAVNQLPIQMSHLGNAANFNNNSSLILHGVNLGALYNY